jgi:hypothetical protein
MFSDFLSSGRLITSGDELVTAEGGIVVEANGMKAESKGGGHNAISTQV